MHNLASLRAREIIRLIGLRGVKTALDLGGGPGTYSIEMARKGVHVILFDRPETIEIAKKFIKKSLVKKINFIAGDFLFDKIGKGYDLIFISQALHSISEKDNIQLLGKCKKALNKGGRIIIQEAYLSNDRTHPLQSALSSVNMLINTVGGRCYSSKEIKTWILKIGLRDIKERVIDDSVLISGRLL
jgi:2-polyprenyl-3-methyl-5-hydroxy-6-metoxy-1,4-benzoquinol methylase